MRGRNNWTPKKEPRFGVSDEGASGDFDCQKPYQLQKNYIIKFYLFSKAS